MNFKKASAIVSMVTMAVALIIGSGASAQFIDDGPTPGDFTVDGVFDQESYTTALITFQSASILELGGTTALSIRGCPSGITVSAEYVGFPASKVETTSTGGTNSLTIAAPDGAEQGYNVIRVTCGSLVRDQIVNLQQAGTAGIVRSLSINVAAGSTPPSGGLPRAGSDARTVMGIAAALLLLGGAVTFGAQRRFSSAD
ncbi:MAG: hypothetical protein ACI9AO_000367 [Ilumatobacter sp.]|jgi:hypothetical protein